MAFPFVMLTPFGKVFDGPTDALYVDTTKGRLGILPNHTSLIDELPQKGVLKIETQGKTIYAALFHGALMVKADRVVILSESATLFDSEEKAKEFLLKDRKPLSFEDESLALGEKMLQK